MNYRALFPLAIPCTVAGALFFAVACGPSAGGRNIRDVQGDGGTPVKNDPNRDSDGDGITPAQGDCNDADPLIFPALNGLPGAPELCDGKDHDCDSIPDGPCDDDMDGYAILPNGDKNLPGGDCNDQNPLVGPGAAEVPDDMVDNNCDGMVDEKAAACDGSVKKDGKSLAGAMELCSPWVMDAKLNKDADAMAYAVKKNFGMGYKPKQGGNFVMLSTGIAADKLDANFNKNKKVQPGTDFGTMSMNPLPMNQKNNVCGADSMDPLEVNDYVELTLTLKVPSNAKAFSFQFMFVSAEYPEFVGTEFNDKFLAILDSKAFKGNISFDAKMNPITINVGFFDVCDKASKICSGSKPGVCTKPIDQLNGTGYEDTSFGSEKIGGGTGWLTTTAPVMPGETATLRFIIFDEGDNIYDSSVIIDNFQWKAEGSMDPMTIP
ncbi:MAG: hypothetical protein EXR72_23675 [Myxococcales bacterium]|nr:hypothetical protein [Myxococcales bacterium]